MIAGSAYLVAFILVQGLAPTIKPVALDTL
jgi:hypothetical protein